MKKVTVDYAKLKELVEGAIRDELLTERAEDAMPGWDEFEEAVLEDVDIPTLAEETISNLMI